MRAISDILHRTPEPERGKEGADDPSESRYIDAA